MKTLRKSHRGTWLALIGKSLLPVVAVATVATVAPLAANNTRVAGVSAAAEAPQTHADPEEKEASSAQPAPNPEPAAAPAPGSTQVDTGKSSAGAKRPPAKSWEQRHGEKALARIRYPWQNLGYKIVFKSAHPYYRGMTYGSQRRIEIYVRRSDSIEQTAFDLGHEIGHAVDFTYLTDERKAQWRRLRGYTGSKRSRSWYGCNRCEDYSTPAGDFAEVFAYWRVRHGRYFKSRMAGLPSARQLEQLDDLMQPPPKRKPAARPAPSRRPSGSQETRPSSGSGQNSDARPQSANDSGQSQGGTTSSGDNRSVYRRTVDSLPLPTAVS